MLINFIFWFTLSKVYFMVFISVRNTANDNTTMYRKEFGKDTYQHDIPNRCQFYVNNIVEAEVEIIQKNKQKSLLLKTQLRGIFPF